MSNLKRTRREPEVFVNLSFSHTKNKIAQFKFVFLFFFFRRNENVSENNGSVVVAQRFPRAFS